MPTLRLLNLTCLSTNDSTEYGQGYTDEIWIDIKLSGKEPEKIWPKDAEYQSMKTWQSVAINESVSIGKAPVELMAMDKDKVGEDDYLGSVIIPSEISAIGGIYTFYFQGGAPGQYLIMVAITPD